MEVLISNTDLKTRCIYAQVFHIALSLDFIICESNISSNLLTSLCILSKTVLPAAVLSTTSESDIITLHLYNFASQ